MFDQDNLSQGKQRLKILFFLRLLNNPIHQEKLIDFFVEHNFFTFLEIRTLIEDMKQNNLLKESNQYLNMSDHGIVALSFFLDRLEPSTQNEIEHFYKKDKDRLFVETLDIYQENDHWVLQIFRGHKQLLRVEVLAKENPFKKFENLSPSLIMEHFLS